MLKDKYIYSAILDFAEDGISVEFPDLPGCLSCADTEEEAFINAREVLELFLYCLEKDQEEIPEATPLKDIKLESNQKSILVQVYMPPVRDEMANKVVKTTVTMPKWLKDIAESKKVNFSQVLQSALKAQLNVQNSGSSKSFQYSSPANQNDKSVSLKVREERKKYSK